MPTWLKDLLPVIIIPIFTWVASTYAFTEIMRVRMADAVTDRAQIRSILKDVRLIQTDQGLRISLLEDDQGELQLQVRQIEDRLRDRNWYRNREQKDIRHEQE